jgi:hypothetical protein
MSGAGARYHRCGKVIWLYYKLVGKKWVSSFASLEAHRTITHCPQCGEALRESNLTSEKPKLRQKGDER